MSRRAAVLVLVLVLAPAAAQAAGRSKPGNASCGIVPVSTRLSANGFLVDFRYRVTDGDLAKPLFRDGVRPQLVDRATGGKLLSPSDSKLGSLRSSPRTKPTPGKVYYVLFSNPARAVHAGSTVDLSFGECRFRRLVIQ